MYHDTNLQNRLFILLISRFGWVGIENRVALMIQCECDSIVWEHDDVEF